MDDRRLEGGTRRLIVYRTDTGVSLSVQGVPVDGESGLVREDKERTTTAGGGTRTRRIDRSASIVISDMAAVETLQSWALDTVAPPGVGAPKIKGIILGRTEGAHRVWMEPVPVDLEIADASFGGLAGHVLTLRTSRYTADVTVSDDLNALATWRDDDADGVADDYTLTGSLATDPTFTGAGPTGWQTIEAAGGESATFWRDVVLPAPGLRVRVSTILTGGATGTDLVDDPGDDSEIEVVIAAFPFGGAPPDPVAGEPDTVALPPLDSTTESITAEGEANAWLTLPARTHIVRMAVTIAGGTPGLLPVHIREPKLFTRAESSLNVLNGGFLDRGESTDTEAWKIEEFGSATVEENSRTLTFFSTDYESDYFTLGPGALLDVIATDHADPTTDPHTLILDTTAT